MSHPKTLSTFLGLISSTTALLTLSKASTDILFLFFLTCFCFPSTAPGWTLGWTWAKKEVIWTMMGGQTTEQGDCSKFKGNVPHCCKQNPTIVDLLPGTPYNKQIANCGQGGVLSSWAQDPTNAVASFQVSVGRAGTTNKIVKVPKNFTLNAKGPGYTCGPGKIVPPTKFITSDKSRVTQALMTWNVTCTCSQFLAQKTPTRD